MSFPSPSASSTIAAIATGPSSGGVGIIRLSGPEAIAIGRALAPGVPTEPEARRAYFASFADRSGRVLDEGLFLSFRAPHSYTGEDVVELQVHGGRRLLALLLDEVLATGQARLAEPGEFTRRAFLNGRIDLARAEAVADLVAASSEAAVRAASAQLRGALSGKVAEVRGPLLGLHADVEGVLGFPDEAGGADVGLAPRLAEAAESLAGLLASARAGGWLRRGAQVVLYGPVNAGKSTLFNRLLGAERALVDPEPGTTRDLLEGRFELEGLEVALFDTAGLREQPGRLEALGIDRARGALASADLALLLLPPGVGEAEAQRWRAEAGTVPLLVVRSQADRIAPAERGDEGLWVSASTGEGLEELRAALVEKLVPEGISEGAQVTSERHRDALARAAEAIERAVLAEQVSTLEVVAGELNLATSALGEITGENAHDALLDEIFRRFCIGK